MERLSLRRVECALSSRDGDFISWLCGAMRRVQRGLNLMHWALDSAQSFGEGLGVTDTSAELFLVHQIKPPFSLNLSEP